MLSGTQGQVGRKVPPNGLSLAHVPISSTDTVLAFQKPTWPKPKKAEPHQNPIGLWISELLEHFLSLGLFQGDLPSGGLVTLRPHGLPAQGEQNGCHH